MKTSGLFSVGRRLALVCLVGLFLSGCGSKVTKENFEKIKFGMSESEVSDILGSPSESKDLLGNKIAFWKDDKHLIMITFASGKVNGCAFLPGEEIENVMTKMSNSAAKLAPAVDLTKVTKANFDRVTIGMTEAQVIAILGKPTQCFGNSLLWTKPGKGGHPNAYHLLVDLTFFGGKVGVKVSGVALQ